MLQQPTILIVDDQEINRLILGEVLRRQGYETVEAGNGCECRALASSTPPDLILLDVMMPGERGFETCRRLKENPLTADIPIIFVSAVTDLSSKMEGFAAGAVDYITKPFHAVEIAARVKLHLRLARAQNDLTVLQAQRLAQIAEAQREMLADPADDPEARYHVARRSMAEAGGDFHDVLRLGRDSHFYFVADVSGHGLKASFTTAALKALTAQNATTLYSPAETLKTMNSVLLRILGEGNHITAVAAAVNRARNTIEVVTAGHPPALWQKKGGEITEVGAPGEPLGAFPSLLLQGRTLNATPGDRLFLYTDGIIEANGKTRAENTVRLLELLAATAKKPISAAVEDIFGKMASTEDDATLMGVEV